jgi:hypothetical protein
MQEIAVTNIIKVGSVKRLHPTEGYLGIERGIIKVVDILEVPALNSECLEEANTWIETSLIDKDNASEVQDLTESIMDQPWVAYQYTHSLCRNFTSELGKTYYLPLDVFQSSITSY